MNGCLLGSHSSWEGLRPRIQSQPAAGSARPPGPQVIGLAVRAVRSRMLSSAQLPSGSSPERGHRRTSGRGGSGPVTCSRASTRPAGRGRAPPGPAGRRRRRALRRSPRQISRRSSAPNSVLSCPGGAPPVGRRASVSAAPAGPGLGRQVPPRPAAPGACTGANGVPAGRTSAGPGAEARSSSGSGRRLLTRRRSASRSAAPGPAARRPGAARGAEVWPRPDLGGGRLRPFAPGGSVTARARRRGGRGASTSAALRPRPPAAAVRLST